VASQHASCHRGKSVYIKLCYNSASPFSFAPWAPSSLRNTKSSLHYVTCAHRAKEAIDRDLSCCSFVTCLLTKL
jgi:hypothetical protein